MAGLFHYFVEGECETALLKALMHSQDNGYFICPGKIEIVNVIYEKISVTKAMTLKKGTKVVFVYDTDVKKTDVLEKNIDTLISFSCVGIEDIIFVQSYKTLEDEIVYSCSGINDINKLLATNSKEDFKRKFINHKDIVSKLASVGFDINKIWSRKPKDPFSDYDQGFKKIIRRD